MIYRLLRLISIIKLKCFLLLLGVADLIRFLLAAFAKISVLKSHSLHSLQLNSCATAYSLLNYKWKILPSPHRRRWVPPAEKRMRFFAEFPSRAWELGNLVTQVQPTRQKQHATLDSGVFLCKGLLKDD